MQAPDLRTQLRRPATVAVLAALVPTTLAFVYLHEWAHGLGYWLQGWAACISLNNTWPATEPRRLLLLGGLMGPLFTLAVAVTFLLLHLAIRRFRPATFVLCIVNVAAHPIGTLAFVTSVGLRMTNQVSGDEAIIAAMLPGVNIMAEEVEARIGALTIGFLFRPWSLLMIWGYLLVHAAMWATLIFRAHPLVGDYRSPGLVGVAFGIVILLSALYSELAPRLGWTVCF